MVGHKNHRLRVKDRDALREYIRAEMIIDRLQRAFFREPLEGYTDPVTLSETQIQIATTLLKKTLPDLSATELTGDTTQRIVSADVMDEAAWRAKYETPDGRVTPLDGGGDKGTVQ